MTNYLLKWYKNLVENVNWSIFDQFGKILVKRFWPVGPKSGPLGCCTARKPDQFPFWCLYTIRILIAFKQYHYWPVRPGAPRGRAWSVGPARRRHRRRLVALCYKVRLAATPLAGQTLRVCDLPYFGKYGLWPMVPTWYQSGYQARA